MSCDGAASVMSQVLTDDFAHCRNPNLLFFFSSRSPDQALLCEHVITSLFSVGPQPQVGRVGIDTPPLSPKSAGPQVPQLGEFIVSFPLRSGAGPSPTTNADRKRSLYPGICTLPYPPARLDHAPGSPVVDPTQDPIPVGSRDFDLAAPTLPLVPHAQLQDLDGRHILEQELADRRARTV